MNKFLLLITLFGSALLSKEISASVENSIMIEAIMFVAVFGGMGVISYIYSSRHAKAYKKPESVAEVVTEEMIKANRIAELRQLLKNKVLSEEEFELLNNYHLQK
ncbi:MAG: hypothetical protein U9Q40_00450 [Campylobacterota bacterium]|nr:hypothetical protein [Campylobacterota bacterium]